MKPSPETLVAFRERRGYGGNLPERHWWHLGNVDGVDRRREPQGTSVTLREPQSVIKYYIIFPDGRENVRRALHDSEVN